jgi:hypothetical protein
MDERVLAELSSEAAPVLAGAGTGEADFGGYAPERA